MNFKWPYFDTVRRYSHTVGHADSNVYADMIVHAKFRLDPSNRLATVHERHRQDRTDRTDRQRTDIIGRGPKTIEICWAAPNRAKLANRSQPLVGLSLPRCEDIWEIHCCLTSFFPIVDMCLNCEDMAQKVVAWCPYGEFFGDFWVLHFQLAACSTFQICILNSH